MYFSPTDEMVTTIEDLTTCTQYSLEIGAGPVTRDNEEDETIQENWRFGEDSFKTFATTSPVSKIGLTELSLIIFPHQRLLVGRGRR